jgi:hypothetical protein
MPTATLLQIVQRAADELGLARPSIVAAAADNQTRQLFALANRCGTELLKKGGWASLQTEFVIAVGPPTVTTGNTTASSAVVTNIPSTAGIVAGTFAVTGNNIVTACRVASVDSLTQVTLTEPATSTATGVTLAFTKDTFAIPSDFDRFVDRTHWDRTQRWELIGPMSPQEDQWVRSGIVSTGPRRRWRQVGRAPNTFRIWPPPSTNDTPSVLSWEYYSNAWVQTAGGYYTARMTADTDTALFDENLMVLGLKWMFFQAKGFQYQEVKQMWDRAADAELARDGGAQTLSMARRRFPIFLSPANVQDANFPGPG